MLPNLLAAKFSSSVSFLGGGSFAIKVFAASILNFGFAVRAGAPRLSQASSFRINIFRLPSSTVIWRARSAFDKTYAE